MEVESPTGARRSRGLRVVRPCECLSEKAIVQGEANFGSTGLISNGLAAEQTSVMAIMRVSPFGSDALFLHWLIRDEKKIVADGQGQSDLSPRVPGRQQCGRPRGGSVRRAEWPDPLKHTSLLLTALLVSASGYA